MEAAGNGQLGPSLSAIPWVLSILSASCSAPVGRRYSCFLLSIFGPHEKIISVTRPGFAGGGGGPSPERLLESFAFLTYKIPCFQGKQGIVVGPGLKLLFGTLNRRRWSILR